MISIKKLYDAWNVFIRSGSIPVLDETQLNSIICLAEIELFNKYADSFEVDKASLHKLRPYIVEKSIDVVDGVVKLPKNYKRDLQLGYITYRIEDKVCQCDKNCSCKKKTVEYPIDIEYVQSNAWNQRMSSYDLRPDIDCPIYRHCDNGLQIAPKSITKVHLKYLKKPKYGKIVIGYNQSECEDIQYLDTKESVDFEWDEEVFPELFQMVFTKTGVALKDIQTVNLSQV